MHFLQEFAYFFTIHCLQPSVALTCSAVVDFLTLLLNGPMIDYAIMALSQ